MNFKCGSGPSKETVRLGAPGANLWPSGQGLQVPVGSRDGTELGRGGGGWAVALRSWRGRPKVGYRAQLHRYSSAVTGSLDVTLQGGQRGHDCAHFTKGNRGSVRG